MPDLIPSPPPFAGPPGSTTEAPHPYGNVPGAIEGAYNETARGLKEAGAGLMDVATPLAERQAASDLENQKITLGPDGKLQVLNPAHSFAFGAAGNAAADVIRSGTVAQASLAVDGALTDIHQKHLGDPQGQEAANQAFVDGLKGTTGNPIIDAAVMSRAGERAQQHYDSNLEFTTRLRTANDERDLTAQKSDIEESLATLAQSGVGAGDPKYDQLMDQRKAIQEKFAGNPLLKRTPDMVALEDKQFGSYLQGQHLISGLDAIVQDKGMKAGLDAADAIRLNTTLSSADRTRLWSEARARLQQMAPEAEARIQGSQENVKSVVKLMDKSGSQPLPGDLRSQAFGALQDAEKAGDLTGAGTLRAQMLIHGIPMSALRDPGDAAPAAPASPNEPSVQAHGGAPQESSVTPEAMSRAILGQESGGNPNVGTSTDNAHGIGQIIPATFNQYAKPGERIDNPADNLAVHQRIIADYSQRWPNDPARVAVAYFSGPGNVSPPGSPHPWITDAKDGNGKYTSSYVSDVQGRLGQGGSGGGLRRDFTPQEYAANPMLRSQVLRSMIGDPEEKYSFLSAKASMIDTIAKVGIEPPPADLAAIKQGALDNPDEPRFQKLWADAAGYQMAREAVGGGAGGGGLPARAGVEKQIDELAHGPDLVLRQVAAVAQDKEKSLDQFKKEQPYTFASNLGITKGAPPMIDPSNPASLAPTLAQRYDLSQGIGKMLGEPPPPLFQKDEAGTVGSIMAGPGGAQAVQSLGQLKPEVLSSLSGDASFRDNLVAMSHSTDPAKLNAAYGLMDTLARQNPLDFDAKFKDGIKDLTIWQKNLSMLPPDQIAKRMQQYNDPNERQAFDKAAKVADKNLENVSPSQIVSKFSTGGFLWMGAAQPPQSEPGRVDAQLALKSDYDEAYRDAFAETSNASTADAVAMRKLSAKWSQSEVNGNRVMAYAPEQAYRNKDGSPMTVDGSMGWMKTQLDEDVLKSVGDTGGAQPGQARALWEGSLTAEQQENLAKASAPRSLVSDATTQADVASGKPASYKVVIQDKDGRFQLLSDPRGAALRVRFDPSMARASQIEKAETQRAASQAPVQPPANPFDIGPQ